MELLQLKYFRIVAETGKINAAAAALYISPPALSASISRLERELGVKLFKRTNNRIMLNEQGEIFLMYVNQIFNCIESAKLDIEHSLLCEDVTIHVAATMSDLWMKLIADYSTSYPDTSLAFTAKKVPQLATIDLINQYSFLLAEGGLGLDSLESIMLFQDYVYVMLPENHPLSGNVSIDIHDLSDEIVFMPQADQTLNQRLRKSFKEASFFPKRGSEFSYSVCQYMVSIGRGISFTTQNVQNSIGNIRCVRLSNPYFNWAQCLYWNRSRVFTKSELQFKEFVIDFCRHKID